LEKTETDVAKDGKQDPKRITTTQRASPTETGGEVFPDGNLIELVRSGEDAGGLALLTWNGAKGTVGARAEHEGRVFVPRRFDPSLLHALPLPTNCGSFDSTANLLAGIKELFDRYGDLPEDSVSLMVSFVLATWMVDWLPVAPTLTLIDPSTSQATQLLRLLSCVCRRALMLVDLTGAGLCSMPMWLRPTLLIDRQELSPSAQRLLRAGNRRGVHILKNGRVFDLYCAKAISSPQHLGDAVTDAAVEIALSPSRRALPVLDEQVQQQIADEFQPQLLAYRLMNHAKVRRSEFDVPLFTSPLRELARSLGGCIVDAPAFQSRIASVLQEQDEEIRSDRTAEPESIVIEAVLFFCHQAKKDSVRVGDVAKAANAILAGRGETIQLQPRAVGQQLKALGLRTRRLGKSGRGLLLDHKLRRDVHRLARDYEVPSVLDAEDRCPHCVERIHPTKEAEGALGAHGAHLMHKNHQGKSKGGGAA
jgi:hypothetical protein